MQQLQVMLRWFSSRRSRDVACNVVSWQHVWALSREDGCVMVFPSSRQMSARGGGGGGGRRRGPRAAPRGAAARGGPGGAAARGRRAEGRRPSGTNEEQGAT